jgi:hypothetical protein
LTVRNRESKIERHLAEEIHRMGGLCFKWTSPGCRGVPDRVVIVAGLVCFVELKVPGGRLSKAQIRMHKRLTAEGALVFTAVGFDGVDRVVEAIKMLASWE